MEFEGYIGIVLRAGVILSILLILIGLSIIAASGAGSSAAYLLSFNTAGISAHGIIEGIASGIGIYYIILGLIVLVATPVLRVLLSVIWFALEKNVLYTIITAIVLLNLIIAIFLVPHFIGSLRPI